VSTQNRLLSRKTVSFSFAEPYDFAASLLASVEASPSTTCPSLCDEKSQRIKWCRLVNHLQTYFSRKSVPDECEKGIPAPFPTVGNLEKRIKHRILFVAGCLQRFCSAAAASLQRRA
jgi:hypothetical protein